MSAAATFHIWMAFFFAAWFLWIPVTFWFGRIFCRYVCPLGLAQSLVHRLVCPRTHVRRVCEALPRSRWQRVISWTIVAVYFLTPLGVWVAPWGIVGRVLVGFLPGVVWFLAVLLSALFGQGRFWCNWICPLGTIFDLVANIGLHRDRPCASCKHCRRCFS